MRVLAIILVGLLIAAFIAWDAAERHYDACVNAAKATAKRPDAIDRDIERSLGGNMYAEDLRRRVKGCSRLPW
jgi:hypothetical protein